MARIQPQWEWKGDEDIEMVDYFRDFAAELVLMAIGIGFGFGKGPRLDVQKSGGPVSLDVAGFAQ